MDVYLDAEGVIFAGLILINFLARVYWAVLDRPKDIRHFLPEKENKGTLFTMMAYYYFLRKTKPKTCKYNGWQKSTCFIWTISLWFMVFTGSAMLWKTHPFWAWVVDLFGGPIMIHSIHYLVMWFFVLTTVFHAYLVITEEYKSFLVMFIGIEPDSNRWGQEVN